MIPKDKRQPREQGRRQHAPPPRPGYGPFVEVEVEPVPKAAPVTLEERFKRAKLLISRRGVFAGFLIWAVTYWLVIGMAYHQENLSWREFLAVIFARAEPGWWHLTGVLVGALVYSIYRFGRANWLDCFITTLASLALYGAIVAIANRDEIYYNPGYRWETLGNFLFLNGSRHDISAWNFIAAILALLLLVFYSPARPWFLGLFDLPQAIRRPAGRIRGETITMGVPPRSK